MKRYLMFLGLCLSLAFSAVAAEKVEPPKSCQQCGMDREAFAQSRMQIVFADGTTVGECSLNCAVVEMKQHKEKQVKSLLVADYRSKKLTDARMAVWVIGGAKSGVMTTVPKWAFAVSSDAQKFVKENGGRVSTFNEALDMAVKENE
jgi:nitrous oxide reductase accessory protein NosL